jgi:hypothetical protein
VKVKVVSVSEEWHGKIAALATELGVSQRVALERLLDASAAMAKAASDNGLEATTGRVVATSEDGSLVLTDHGDDGAVFYTKSGIPVRETEDGVYLVDEIPFKYSPEEDPFEGDPLAQFPGVIVPTSGEGRDFDTVFTAGCPACERGSPRRGALHNCGRSNAGFDMGRHAI